MAEAIDAIMTRFRRELGEQGLAPRPSVQINSVRISPEARRRIIIEAARAIAKEHGLDVVTLATTARACSVYTSVSLIKHYFKNQEGLRRAARG